MSFLRALSNGFVFFVGLAVAVPAAYAKPLTKAEANQVISEGEYSVRSGHRMHHPSGTRAVASVRSKRTRGSSAAYRVVAHRTRKKESRRSPSRSTAKHVTSKKTTSRKPVARKAPAAKGSKKIGRTSSRPSRKIASAAKHGKSAKRGSKHGAKRAPKHESKHAKKSTRTPSRRQAAKSSAKHRFPVARETPNERDMPFVSIPHRKVSRHDRTIVMDDPSVRSPLPAPRAPSPELKPDATALTTPEGEPAEVGQAKAEMAPPPVVGPAPASVTETPPAAANADVAATMPEMSAVPPEAAAAAAAHADGREPDAFDLHSGADPMAK